MPIDYDIISSLFIQARSVIRPFSCNILKPKRSSEPFSCNISTARWGLFLLVVEFLHDLCLKLITQFRIISEQSLAGIAALRQTASIV